jgi:YegS/Rv2252/BmrU family lipid kinase
MNRENKYLIIVNPNAGAGKGRADWPLIKSLLEKEALDFKYFLTEKPEDAIKLCADNISEQYKKIVAVGGDGTINEVVNGIFLQDKIPTNEIVLSAILVGTGNDWGKMFNIPKDYMEAIKLIKEEKTFEQDVGIVSFFNADKKKCRYFINAAGLGFDALVAKTTNKQKEEGKSSTFSYMSALIKSLFRYKPLPVKINIEEKGDFHNGKLFTLSIGIGKYTGGGMKQTPDAEANDGLFDLMMVEKIAKGKIIRKISKLYNGKINSLKEVKTLKTSKLVVESDSKLLIEIDGESVGHGPFEFDLIQKALNIIVD